jgi:hypothetical protein
MVFVFSVHKSCHVFNPDIFWLHLKLVASIPSAPTVLYTQWNSIYSHQLKFISYLHLFSLSVINKNTSCSKSNTTSPLTFEKLEALFTTIYQMHRVHKSRRLALLAPKQDQVIQFGSYIFQHEEWVKWIRQLALSNVSWRPNTFDNFTRNFLPLPEYRS